MFLAMDHTTLIKGDDEVETTRLEMAGVREENLRLKTLLEQIEKDYKALQRRFNDIFRHGNRPPGGDDQEQELVSLRLGTMSQPEINKGRNSGGLDKVEIGGNNYELKLGMDYNSDRLRTEGVFQNPGLDEKWPPGKKGFKRDGDQGFSQTSEKKARVCVRARCDTPTMNDGCQWRKYGQKISKGNPCPRAYYRCTISSSCPVRKQVQRCMDDTSVLITTYEGKHNHPLPLAATAMASTTSAAASMLLSGSSTSPATPIFFHGHPCNNLKSQTWPYNYYLSTSPSAPFPTLTLDLTNTLNSSSPNTPFTLHSSCPGIPGTNPTISSSDPNYKSSTEAFGYKDINDCEFSPPGKSGQDLNYQSCLEKLNQGALTNTLTEAITSDPSFKSVIAAALSTMVANRGPGKFNQGERVQNHGKDLIERGHHAPAAD